MKAMPVKGYGREETIGIAFVRIGQVDYEFMPYNDKGTRDSKFAEAIRTGTLALGAWGPDGSAGPVMHKEEPLMAIAKVDMTEETSFQRATFGPRGEVLSCDDVYKEELQRKIGAIETEE